MTVIWEFYVIKCCMSKIYVIVFLKCTEFSTYGTLLFQAINGLLFWYSCLVYVYLPPFLFLWIKSTYSFIFIKQIAIKAQGTVYSQSWILYVFSFKGRIEEKGKSLLRIIQAMWNVLGVVIGEVAKTLMMTMFLIST